MKSKNNRQKDKAHEYIKYKKTSVCTTV